MVDPISVLHVDDEPGLAEMAALRLQQAHEVLSVRTETAVADALDTLDEAAVDCIVSDYDMPRVDGLEFLDRVREDHPDLPFILFTGQGSEDIAAEAISRGVTDYLQKTVSGDQYAVLANRIVNAVSQYRTERTLARTRERFTKLVEGSSDLTLIVDREGTISYVSPSVEQLLGYEPSALDGTDAATLLVADERAQARRSLETVADSSLPPDSPTTFRVRTADGEVRVFEVKARNLTDEPAVGGIVVNARDVTAREAVERELREQVALLRTVSEVGSDRSLDAPATLQRLLDAGADYLDFPVGYVTRVADDTQTVVAATGDHDILRVGERTPLSETYCRFVLEDTDAVTVAHESDLRDDPAYERFGLACYVGTPVVVDGDPYGTLCFADAAPREDAIDETDRSLVALLAQVIGYEFVIDADE